MDTTPKYIKMCENAGEIQNGWEPEEADFYHLGVKRNKTPAICILGCHWENCEGCHYEVNELKTECIWLPRQDQLQDMVNYNLVCRDSGEDLFWVLDTDDYISWEQFWLKYVMHELYNKKWDGEEWQSI